MAPKTLSILVFLFPLCFQSLTAIIPLGSSLSAADDNPSWLSPSGEFAFGFRRFEDTKLLLLAIWYDKIPSKTVVWHGNGGYPVEEGWKVELRAEGLVLSDSEGRATWKAEMTTPVSYGAMLETGNLVLAYNDSVYGWQSFDNPTDTILPSQTLERDGILSSRLSESNYTKGRFQLSFIDGDLRLSPMAWPTGFLYPSYYSDEATSNASRLVFNESGSIYTLKITGELSQLPRWNFVDANPSENYYRATLDYSGVFTQYSHPRGSSGTQNWSVVQYIPDNICFAIGNEFGSGACGYNSICVIELDRPTCKCPNGYSLMNPNDQFGGCKPNFPQGCGIDDGSEDPEDLYEMQELQGVNWPFGDYEKLTPFTEPECKMSCLHDCLCSVAILGITGCWKKRLPFGNGRVETGRTKALIKVRKQVPPTDYCRPVPTRKKSQGKTNILIGSLGISLAISLFLGIFSLINFRKNNRERKEAVIVSTLLETNLHKFTYRQVEEATESFKEEIGRGSFGVVYKAIFKQYPEHEVAVKKLDKLSPEGEREFKTELKSIGKTCHKNLVRLLGFCEEGVHRLLLYEFMSNGTLASFLFGLDLPDWRLRTEIALGIARGLVYLHEECDSPIIHCDIKPQNILLDEQFRAKISDFGLAKLLLSDQSRTSTMIRGTRGYVAPEWFKSVPVTAKVDVYSYGILLLEIICCRKNVLMKFDEDDNVILADWANDCYVEGRVDLLVEKDEKVLFDKGRLQRWVMIALCCIQEDPARRPSMKMVLQMLEGFVEVPLPPMVHSSLNLGCVK